MDHLQIGDENANLLGSQANIWNHIFKFITSMTLNCVVLLEIPDIINNHGGQITLSELIKALPINKEKSHFVPRVMRILVYSGFFVKHSVPKFENGEEEEGEEEEEDCYSLTPTSRLLLRDEPFSMRPFLLAMVDPTLMEPWQHLCEWFKNDDPNAFFTAHGRTLSDYAGSEQRFNLLFNDAMASDSNLISKLVVKDFGGVFEGLRSLVDVGGGTGIMTMAISKAFTHIRCINFDLPHVVAGLEGSETDNSTMLHLTRPALFEFLYLQRNQLLTETVIHIGGDMFIEIPTADAVLLKAILHNWTDKQCIKILKLCKEAIPSKENGGKVIIIDFVVDDKKMDKESYETQLFFDLEIMLNNEGKERTENEWAKLFFAGGFTDYKIMSVLGLRSIIEVYP